MQFLLETFSECSHITESDHANVVNSSKSGRCLEFDTVRLLRLTKLSRECRVDAEDGDQKNGGGKRPHHPGADWRGGGRTALASSKLTI